MYEYRMHDYQVKKNIVDMDSSYGRKVSIQISWFHQKPADLELHCFQKIASALIRLNILFVVFDSLSHSQQFFS